MVLFIFLSILAISIVIGLNILTYRSVVNKALKKFIEPKLNERGLTFVKYKWPGLLSNGDFKPDDIKLTFMNKNGSPYNSQYAYIYYKDGNETQKITVRIDTAFLSINKIVYSSEF